MQECCTCGSGRGAWQPSVLSVAVVIKNATRSSNYVTIPEEGSWRKRGTPNAFTTSAQNVQPKGTVSNLGLRVPRCE